MTSEFTHPWPNCFCAVMRSHTLLSSHQHKQAGGLTHRVPMKTVRYTLLGLWRRTFQASATVCIKCSMARTKRRVHPGMSPIAQPLANEMCQVELDCSQCRECSCHILKWAPATMHHTSVHYVQHLAVLKGLPVTTPPPSACDLQYSAAPMWHW